jgi:hypothetical protein
MVDGKSHTPCRSLISLLVDETGRTDSSCGALGGGGVALDRSISRRVLGLGRGSSPARGGSGEGLRSDLPGHAKREQVSPVADSDRSDVHQSRTGESRFHPGCWWRCEEDEQKGMLNF